MPMPREEDNYFAPPQSVDPTATTRDEVEPVDPTATHEVRFRWEPGDLEAFHKAHHQAPKPTAAPKSKTWVWLVMIAVVAGVLFQMPSRRQGASATARGAEWMLMLTYLGIGVGFVTLVVVGNRWVARRQRRRWGRDLDDVPEQFLKISIAGIEGHGGDGSLSRRPWRSVREALMTDAVILLYVTNRKSDQPIAVMIPRRAFDTVEAGERFGKAALYWSRISADLPETFGRPAGESAGRTIRFQLDAAERRYKSRANRLAFRKIWKSLLVVGLLTIGCLVVVVAQVRRMTVQGLESPGPVVGLFLGSLGLAIFGWVTFKASRLLILGPRPGENDLGPVELELRPEALFTRTVDGQEVGCVWSRIHEISGDDRSLRFVQKTYRKSNPEGAVTCVPRRAFESLEEGEAFLAEARRLWSNSAESAENPARA